MEININDVRECVVDTGAIVFVMLVYYYNNNRTNLSLADRDEIFEKLNGYTHFNNNNYSYMEEIINGIEHFYTTPYVIHEAKWLLGKKLKKQLQFTDEEIHVFIDVIVNRFRSHNRSFDICDFGLVDIYDLPVKNKHNYQHIKEFGIEDMSLVMLCQRKDYPLFTFDIELKKYIHEAFPAIRIAVQSNF